MQLILYTPQIIWILFHLISVIVVFASLDEEVKGRFLTIWFLSTSFEIFLLYWGGFFSNGMG